MQCGGYSPGSTGNALKAKKASSWCSKKTSTTETDYQVWLENGYQKTETL